jgi:tRNA threonylcarbamoyl adenosine modification protein YeaZ
MSPKDRPESDTLENTGNMANTAAAPLILAIETSSRIGSAALALGDRLIEESAFSGPMSHSEEIFPTIERLLTRQGRGPRDIAQIHIAAGPGSFTGLRIAVTLAKSMALAQGVRIVTVDSLDVVAANLADDSWDAPLGDNESRPVPLPNRIAALFDAKRGQFYVSVYDRTAPGKAPAEAFPSDKIDYQIPAPRGDFWRKVHPDSLMTAREIVDGFAGAGVLGVLGDGLLYHRDEFAQDNVRILPENCWSPHAACVHRLGWQKAQRGRFDDPVALTPFYLRGPQVTLKRKP